MCDTEMKKKLMPILYKGKYEKVDRVDRGNLVLFLNLIQDINLKYKYLGIMEKIPLHWFKCLQNAIYILNFLYD